MQITNTLVCEGCGNKVLQLGGLEQQKLIISQFLCLRNLDNTYLDPLAQGLSQGCNQGAS